MDGYSGDAGNALMITYNANHISNGMMFSTPDSDNDIHNVNCAGTGYGGWHGGWWYRSCSTSVVNRNGAGIWKTIGDIKDVQASRMLVKPN